MNTMKNGSSIAATIVALRNACATLRGAVADCLEQMSQASELVSENDQEWHGAMRGAEEALALPIPPAVEVSCIEVPEASTIVTPVAVDKGSNGQQFLVAADAELVFSTFDATEGELSEIATALNSKAAARMFFDELLGSVETLTGVAEEHGARTLADLMYLYSAIMHGGFIDHYPSESKVMEIARALPSGEQWSKFIKVEYMQST